MRRLTGPRKALSLVELLVSAMILAMLIFGIYSLEAYGRLQLRLASQRGIVHDEMAYVLEDMQKAVSLATGTPADMGIVASTNGFSVRVDLQSTPTPSNFADDIWVNYTLPAGEYKIYKGNETANSRVSLNARGVFPGYGTGFTYTIRDNGCGVYVYLKGRYDPASAWSVNTNPETEMIAMLYSASASCVP